ncbi:MAG: AMP-binding protein [Methylococcaceae bacterium]|nr:AMP-binding protein [Methylococcaceae bacterium]
MAKSYFHRGGEIPLLGVTIAEHFSSIVAQYPNQNAVICVPQKQQLTYAQLSDQVDQVAKGLIAFGYGKGDRIGIWSTNNLQWILIQMATAKIGAVLVNINPAYRVQELEYALKQSRVQCLVTIPAFRNSHYMDMLIELSPELRQCQSENIKSERLADLSRIIVYDPLDPEQTTVPYSGFTTWQSLISTAEQTSQYELNQASASLDTDDAINIQYTSGTTGFPKAVVLSHHNILNNAWFSALAMHVNEQDRLCIAVPFYHCFGMVIANLLCFSVGACAVIACDYFDAEAVLKAVEKYQCTALHGVPTMFIAELEHKNFKQYRLDSLRTGIIAGAPCPPELMQKIMKQMHCPEILIGYGETEASPLTHLTTREDNMQRRTQTVGHNLPHQEVKIINIDTNQTVTIGKTGEICFRGYHIMQGYYNNSEATRHAIDAQGWLHSGDLGIMDKDGYISITGRLKDMIIRGGENIYPREIEAFIYTHPKVSEVAVFGVPDDFYGEELAAWIQLHKDVCCEEEEIKAFCRGKLSHFKIPHYIRFVDEFPMTVTGKLKKYQMRKQMIKILQNTPHKN